MYPLYQLNKNIGRKILLLNDLCSVLLQPNDWKLKQLNSTHCRSQLVTLPLGECSEHCAYNYEILCFKTQNCKNTVTFHCPNQYVMICQGRPLQYTHSPLPSSAGTPPCLYESGIHCTHTNSFRWSSSSWRSHGQGKIWWLCLILRAWENCTRKWT